MTDQQPDPYTRLARRQVQFYQRYHRWISSLPELAQGELTTAQHAALAVISAEQATSGGLAERLRVTPAVVTGLVDRLERSGFVERVPDQRDRRRVWLHITAIGQSALDDVNHALDSRIAVALAALGDREVAVLDWSFDHLERMLTRLEERTPEGS